MTVVASSAASLPTVKLTKYVDSMAVEVDTLRHGPFLA